MAVLDSHGRSFPGADGVALAAWVESVAVDAEPPFAFAKLGRGSSNLTYLVTDACGMRWVLRRPPLGPLLASAHDMVRECQVLRRLHEVGVPVPRVVGICEDAAVADAPLLLVEHVEGLVIDSEEAAADVEPALRHALSLTLASSLAQVHAVDLGAAELDDLASKGPYAARQLRRWRKQWQDTRFRDQPKVDLIGDRLARAIPEQRETTLLHGDFHLQNIVWGRREARTLAILDWELCTLGDPLADLGGLLAYWPQGDDAIVPALTRVTTLPGFASRAEVLAAYAERSGRDVSAVGFWHAMACWKLAIIVEGVRRRRMSEPQNGKPLDARIADDLLDRALQVAEEAGL